MQHTGLSPLPLFWTELNSCQGQGLWKPPWRSLSTSTHYLPFNWSHVFHLSWYSRIKRIPTHFPKSFLPSSLQGLKAAPDAICHPSTPSPQSWTRWPEPCFLSAYGSRAEAISPLIALTLNVSLLSVSTFHPPCILQFSFHLNAGTSRYQAQSSAFLYFLWDLALLSMTTSFKRL